MDEAVEFKGMEARSFVLRGFNQGAGKEDQPFG
jgi:hypothetical protein